MAPKHDVFSLGVTSLFLLDIIDTMDLKKENFNKLDILKNKEKMVLLNKFFK